METVEHLVFCWSPSGYTLDVRPGEPPSPGMVMDDGEQRYQVAKLAPSPLPQDRRPCAYLLPGAGNGNLPEEIVHEEIVPDEISPDRHREIVHEEIVPDEISPDRHKEPVAVWTELRSDLEVLYDAVPEGVCVVTVEAQGGRLGRTVDPLLVLSFDPPLVGFVLSSDCPLADVLPDTGDCVISILAGGQEWLADHFAEAARPIDVRTTLRQEIGAPLLVGALGWLECSMLDSVDLGSCTLSVLAVTRVEAGTAAPALVRVRGAYSSV